MLSDIKTFLENSANEATFEQNLLFCLWCISIVPRDLDDHWHIYTEPELTQKIDEFTEKVYQHLFYDGDLDAAYCQSVRAYFDTLEVDEDTIVGVKDEYALELMFQIIASCSYTCDIVVKLMTKSVVQCGLTALGFVDFESVLGTIPDDGNKMYAFISLMKHVWGRILRNEVDPTTFEKLLPAIPLGTDYSWATI